VDDLRPQGAAGRVQVRQHGRRRRRQRRQPASRWSSACPTRCRPSARARLACS
jgi:hypothetical protein